MSNILIIIYKQYCQVNIIPSRLLYDMFQKWFRVFNDGTLFLKLENFHRQYKTTLKKGIKSVSIIHYSPKALL